MPMQSSERLLHHYELVDVRRANALKAVLDGSVQLVHNTPVFPSFFVWFSYVV